MKKDTVERILRESKLFKDMYLCGVEMHILNKKKEPNTKRIDLITALGASVKRIGLIISDLSGDPARVNIKQFRIIDSDRNVCWKFDTLQQVADCLFNISYTQCKAINIYQIECVKDDVIVSATEVLQAYDEGECPGDLQFF
ncbi:hypothetical protein KAR91_70665 [Candidatus Pacearchaeota archaeon]|nr:hypothetical protein [Candidatus Pacearchaeota archaeon]